MIKGKTAALLSTSAALGAMIAGVPEYQLEEYQRFGERLGLAFQVLDDILGIWGDDSRTGKSSKSDLLTGKKSLPVLYALSKNGEFARRWEQGSIRWDELPRMMDLLEASEARDYAQNWADELTSQALAALRNGQPQGEAGAALEELASQLLLRTI